MKQRRVFRTVWMAICATMAGVPFTSCSDSETDSLDVSEVTDVNEVTKVALSISAGKQNGSGSDARKADYDAEDFESGDEIGLYVLSADDLQSAYVDASTCYNMRATYTGSSWKLDNDIFLTNGDAYVIAYYPYDSSIGHTLSTSEDGKLLFDLTPSGSEQPDVLVSEGVTVNSLSPQAKLSLSHVLTRITLAIEVADDITTSGSLTAVTISADNLYKDVGLYIDTNGSFQTYSQSTTTSGLTLSLSETLSTGTETTLDFLIASGSSTTLTAVFTINSKSYDFTLSTNEGETWTAGSQYEFDITFTTDENYGDESEYVNGYYAVDMGLSVRWAAMNVGATSEEKYGNYYQWGETSVPSDGNYSSSNCTLYGSTSITDISGNTTYDAATVNWGSPWRMPTKAEMQELLDLCYSDNGAGSIKYDDTTYSTDGIVGTWFISDNGNKIFIPHAGYYTGTTLYGTNTAGMKNCYLWLSTLYSKNFPYYLYGLYTSGAWAFWCGSFTIYFGLPVRPVCDYDE